jgi:hypothetical protein
MENVMKHSKHSATAPATQLKFPHPQFTCYFNTPVFRNEKLFLNFSPVKFAENPS